MERIIEINRHRVFNLEEARSILPVIRRITQEMSVRAEALISQLESTPATQKSAIAVLENDISKIVDQWNDKIKKLGAIPKGFWLVDFEFGRGYYCWKFPEEDLLYWHTPEDGYSGRRPLEELKLEEKKSSIEQKSSDRSGPDRQPSGRF